jgi:hypothetical protein
MPCNHGVVQTGAGVSRLYSRGYTSAAFLPHTKPLFSKKPLISCQIHTSLDFGMATAWARFD